jgi:hypothetical protein
LRRAHAKRAVVDPHANSSTTRSVKDSTTAKGAVTAVEVEIDVQVLKSEIKETYALVSQEPEKDFIFPTGRPWATSISGPADSQAGRRSRRKAA